MSSSSSQRCCRKHGVRLAAAVSALTLPILLALPLLPLADAAVTGPYVVLGYNELGMHCMNQDFSEICILPPFNTLRAQVIRRGEEPRIITSGAVVKYSIPGNTTPARQTNFWMFAPALFGVNLPANVGLTGNGMSGLMKPTGKNDWAATGIPITPINDRKQLNPYQLGKIDLIVQNKVAATTAAVVPVSWEISCNLCHSTPGISVATDILRKHDQKHGTVLQNSKPVLCAKCHADPALGTPGVANVKTLSHAMHGSHASRMAPVAKLGNACYACHPGFTSNCQRDVHFAKGIFCASCHGDMTAVANPLRRPWVDEPACASCHQKRKPRYQFEEPNKAFKDSRGHGGVHCAACHGPQHATGPAVTAADNAQAIMHQGFAGTIRKCTVCHTRTPEDGFFHSLSEDGEVGERRRQRNAARQQLAPANQSVFGTYQVQGTEKILGNNQMAAMNFQGTLVTLTPTSLQLNKVYQNGTTSQTKIALGGVLSPTLAQQSGTGQSSSGNQVTNYTLTFARTQTGFMVNGTSTTQEVLAQNKAGRTLGSSAFMGSK